MYIYQFSIHFVPYFFKKSLKKLLTTFKKIKKKIQIYLHVVHLTGNLSVRPLER